jgi:hypothetical protein
MSEIDEAYRELAKEQSMYFDWLRGTEIFTLLYSNDKDRLYRFRDIWRGTIGDVSRNSTSGHGWQRAYRERGCYAWQMRGEEAYQFCLGLLPHLGPFHPKRQYSKQCIRAHEDRRYERTGSE